MTTLQFADVLKTNGFDIDRRRIKFIGDIKTVGDFKANVELHRDVIAELDFKVVAE